MLPHSAALYGLSIRSCWPLPSAASGSATFQHIDVLETRSDRLRERGAGIDRGAPLNAWFTWWRASDQTLFLSWRDVLDAAISPDGHTIEVALAPRAPLRMLSDYLLPQVLSFPLIQFGIEPLHASAVALPSGAIAFLGDSGVGKSTLAAACVAGGYTLCTDDVLALTPRETGLLQVMPGPPHLRLFPKSAACFIPKETPSRPMNPHTRKRVYDVTRERHCSDLVPLRAIYALEASRRAAGPALEISELTGTAALHALLRNTFNPLDPSRPRLLRQLDFYLSVLKRVPVRRLSLRRDAAALPEIVTRITDDAFGSAARC